jgi:hypothetical protein
MSREQFAWGLSNGITELAISGVFWLCLGAWATGFSALLVAVPPIVLVGGLLIRGSVRLRRRFPGFSPRSLRGAPTGSRTRRIIIGFYAVTAAQWMTIVLVGGICSAVNRPDLIWPLIGLVVSLHLLPLGWLFDVRPYYLLAVVGTVITLISILGLTDGFRLVVVGLGLGLVMFAGAAYLLAKADTLVGAGAVRSS